MAVAFSTDGSKAIETVIHTSHSTHTEGDIERWFSLEQCKQWIEDAHLSKVALQIPDELQSRAAKIVKWLEAHTECQCFVLADTSYGSCCIDEVAAEHYLAEGIIHFGHSCLSPTKRLPALLVLEKADIDVSDCCRKLKDVLPDVEEHIILMYHVSYYHAMEEIHSQLAEAFSNLRTSKLDISENCSIVPTHQTLIHQTVLATSNQSENHQRTSDNTNKREQSSYDENYTHCCGRCINIDNVPLENHLIFYIGEENLTLSNLMVLWHGCKFYSYNPRAHLCREENMNTNKMLMKRFYLVEKAKDAQIVGIVVGTLGVANYLQVIERLKLLLKKAGKKHYTFVVGKLNVAKLANFMEIDIFVLVACHENSLLDSSEFYKPVITPYELELACNPDRQWTGGIVTDFQQLLPGGQSHVALPEGDIEEQHDVSLVTGGVRTIGVSADTTPADIPNSSLATKDENIQVVLSGTKNAGEFLSQRSWKGLEPELGKTPVTKAVEGRKGIAISYEQEPDVNE